MQEDTLQTGNLTAGDDVDLSDPDNPEWTEEDFARAEGPETLPYNVLVQFPNTLSAVREKYEGKTGVLPLESEVAAALISSGTGWAERANAILRKALNIKDDAPLPPSA